MLLLLVAVALAFGAKLNAKQGLEKHPLCTDDPLIVALIAACKFIAVSVVLPATASKLPLPPLNVAPDTVILPPLLVERLTLFPAVPGAVRVTTLVETVAAALPFATVPFP